MEQDENANSEVIEAPLAQPISYVSFDPATGALLGGFLQILLPEHEDCHIEVSDEQRINWPMYRTNETRDGLEPAPVVAPPTVVPEEVTMGQARLALYDAGLLDQVPTVIATLPDGVRQRAEIEWEYRPTVLRRSEMVALICQGLELHDAARDELFITAAKL